MINLLPGSLKKNLLYARRNSALIRWLSASAIGLLGVTTIVLAGNIYIDRQVAALQKQNKVLQDELNTQDLPAVQKQVGEISDSIKLVNQVLARQLRFSGLFKQIATVTPPGAVLQNLSIAKLEGGIDLQVIAISYDAAAQMQVNLADPSNKIFSKADIVSIACRTPTIQDKDPYLCQMSLRAEFAKDSPYRIVQSNTGTPR